MDGARDLDLVVDVFLDRPLSWGGVDDGACPPDAGHSWVPIKIKTISNGVKDQRTATSVRKKGQRGQRKKQVDCWRLYADGREVARQTNSPQGKKGKGKERARIERTYHALW